MNENKITNENTLPLVLVADDNEEMRLYLHHILKREGYTVLEAVNGAEAVTACRKQQMDIVLLDAVMPELDGFTACTEIRKLKDYERVPVIMITALDDSKSVDQAFEAGASEYITKPVHWNFLMQRIGYLLESFRAAERIRISEARLAEAQRIARLGNWDWDIITNELAWSDEIYRIFGIIPQTFGATYDAFLERVHPDDRELVTESVNRALKEKAPYSIDHRIVLPNGVERFVHEQGEVFRDESDKPVRMVGVVHDITERKQVEEILQESEKFVREILNSLDFSVAVLDVNGVIIAANEPWYAFARANDMDLFDQVGIGVNYLEVCRKADPTAPEAQEVLTGLEGLLNNSLERFELEYPCDSPTEKRWFLMQAVALPAPRGGVLVSHLNITNRKRAEEKLKEYTLLLEEKVRERTAELEVRTRQAEAASRTKSEFLAIMSHELRTPLNAVIGMAEVLEQGMTGPVTTEQQDLLRDISGSGRHLLAILQAILDASGNTELALTEVIVKDLLEEIISRFKEQTAARDISLSTEIALGLPGMLIDPEKIKKLVAILLDNAVKFTPQGGRITVAATRVKDTVEIAVEDTGPGITPEDHLKVFEPFSQVDSSFARKHEGVGLGLFLGRKLAELHNGTLRLEEGRLGKGCRFVITLPADQPRGTDEQ